MPMSPRLLRPRASGAFNPKSISNLTGWWDAADTTTITLNSTTVSEWRDKGAGGYHMAQATAANQPTYAASIFGTLSAIRIGQNVTERLDTNNIYMDVIGNDSSAREITMFAVLKTSSGAANKTIGETDSGSGFGCYHNISNVAYFDAGSESTARVSGTVNVSVLTAGAVFVGRRAAGQVDQWYNGTLVSGSRSNATGSLRTGPNKFSIRATNTGTLAYGEILTYARALTATERLAVQAYLGKKWGITVA